MLTYGNHQRRKSVSVQDKRDIFQIRSRKNPLPANKGNPLLCMCGEEQENSHILQCDITNPGKKIQLDVLIIGSLLEMTTTLPQWKESIENLEILNSMNLA